MLVQILNHSSLLSGLTRCRGSLPFCAKRRAVIHPDHTEWTKASVYRQKGLEQKNDTCLLSGLVSFHKVLQHQVKMS